MLDDRALRRHLHADSIVGAIAVGERAANYAKRYGLFSEPTPLSRVLQYLRPRLADNRVGVFVSSNGIRVRSDALFLALDSMRANLPSLEIIDEKLSRPDVEFHRRITSSEQRAINLERDRASVDKIVLADEERIARYLRERQARPRLTPAQLALEAATPVPAYSPIVHSPSPADEPRVERVEERSQLRLRF